MKQLKELIVIMPVYNEEAIIVKVVREWKEVLDSLKIDYQLWVIDDGSKDKTLEFLESEKKFIAELVVEKKANSGHGPTLVKAYQEAANQAGWIFQVDSDDEISPQYFSIFWSKRNDSNFLIGERVHEHRPLIRRVISLATYFLVRVMVGSSNWVVKDINCPYRLMKTEVFKQFFTQLPLDTFAPNVLISLFVGLEKIKFQQFKIPSVLRQTGIVSIKRWKLFKSVMRALKQTLYFRPHGLQVPRSFPSEIDVN